MNETVIFLAEFNRRRQFRSIGFVSDLSELDALTGEMFMEIQDEISKLEEQKRKKNNKKS